MTDHKYIPALSLKWLTPFYDFLVEGPISGLRIRKNLLAAMGDLNGKKVLDIGCGTGSFSLMIKEKFPAADVVGLDGDPQMLGRARSKAVQKVLKLKFEQGMSFQLPYPAETFDVVLTSFMLHHLDSEIKQKTTMEAYRVLRPGGTLFGVDFVQPRSGAGKFVAGLARRLERIADNFDGFLPVMFGLAGFEKYRETRYYLLGTISEFRASK